jgi:hypothetical protein
MSATARPPEDLGALWEAHRDEIKELYLIEDKTLPDIRIYMDEHHGFRAT